MNGGIEKPFQRIGSTIKLSFVCSGRGEVEKEKKAEKEERARGSVAPGRYQPPTGSGDSGPGPLCCMEQSPGLQRRPGAVTNHMRA